MNFEEHAAKPLPRAAGVTVCATPCAVAEAQLLALQRI